MQTELWSGDKANDLGITLREKRIKKVATTAPAPGSLRAAKAQQWERDGMPERMIKYATTTGTFSAASAARAAVAAAAAVADGGLAATASSQAALAARAAAAGSHAPMVGRKAKGGFVDAADLKERMYRKMHFRHPVMHTVRWQTQAEIDAAAAARSSAAHEATMPPSGATGPDPTGLTGDDAEQWAPLEAEGHQ